MKQKLRVAVLMGGVSSERDVSLISGKEVVKYLDKKKYSVVVYDPAVDLKKIIENKNKTDVVLPILHGYGGEDGKIQGLLDLLDLPYVGSGVLASSIAMNKSIAKIIYENGGLIIPQYQILSKGEKEKIKIQLPCIVKPVSQGSSVGISIAENQNELNKAVKLAFEFENRILVEEYIKGVEITVAVLGNKNPRVLPVIEIIPPADRFFDRQVKYDGSTQEIIPARISKTLTKKVQEIGVKAHQILECRGLSRTDMIVAKSQNNESQNINQSYQLSVIGYQSEEMQNNKSQNRKIGENAKIYVLETNTIPGMTSESLYPKAAKMAGISFPKLLDKLIELSLEGYEMDKK